MKILYQFGTEWDHFYFFMLVLSIYNRESAEVQQKFDDLFETIHNSNENDHPLSRLRGLLPRRPNQGQTGTEIDIVLEQLSQLRECMLS